MKILSSDIEKVIAKELNIEPREVSIIVKRYLSLIATHVTEGDSICIRGLGIFGHKTLKPRRQHCVNRQMLISKGEVSTPSFDFSKSFVSKYKKSL